MTGRLEGTTLFQFNASATDGVNGFNYAQVSIYITDVNDHCPEWDPASLTFDVNETGQAGDLIGQLNATDVDLGVNGTVSYFISITGRAACLNIRV